MAWHIPSDKLPPYDNKMSFVLKCTWRRRIKDIKFRQLNAQTHYFKKKKRKKDNVIIKIQDIEELSLLSMLSLLMLSRMSLITLPFSSRGIQGSKAILSSVVFESSSSKSLSSSTPSRASPRSASPSAGTSSPWCGGSAVF